MLPAQCDTAGVTARAAVASERWSPEKTVLVAEASGKSAAPCPRPHQRSSQSTRTMDAESLTSQSACAITDDDESLASKLREHYRGGYTKTPKKFSQFWFRFLFQFQATSQLYMTLTVLTPFLMENFDPEYRYYFKVFVCYLFVMAQANWLSAICYSNQLPDYRDRPEPVGTWYEKPVDLLDQSSHKPWQDKYGHYWRYCQLCDHFKPPRAHHCKVCGSCILRRDHHCYLIGTCIGHYNQRYFIAFLFYCVQVSFLGIGLTWRYLSYQPECSAAVWYDFLFPVAVVNFLSGSGCLDWQFLLLTFHLAMLVGFGAMAVMYGTGQILLVISGYTMYEVAKQVDMAVTSPWTDNMRLVFGDYWATSFIFPSQILFKQRHEGTAFPGVHYENTYLRNAGKLNVE